MSNKDTAWMFPGYEVKERAEQFKGNEEFRRQQKYLRNFIDKMMDRKKEKKSLTDRTAKLKKK